jgi:hypothetical protein
MGFAALYHPSYGVRAKINFVCFPNVFTLFKPSPRK